MKKIILSFIVLVCLFLVIPQSFAQTGATPPPPPGGTTATPPPPSFELPNPLGTETVEGVLCRIGGWLFWISIPLTAIMIIIGAFQIMFAGGNEEKVRTGKNTILYTVVGFAIILLSTSIIFLIQNLLGASGDVCGQGPADTTPPEFQGETGPIFPHPF